MTKRSRRALGVLLATVACVAAGCASGGQAQQPAGSGREGGGQQGPVPVTVAQVERKAMPRDISVIGTAEAYSTVAVHAQITGELTSVNFNEGDDVEKGQALFTLDRRPLDAVLQQAEANLQRDMAQATNAKSQAARYQDLLQRGIATHEQVDQMATTSAALDATVAADRAAIDSAKVQLQYATIVAPISGRTGTLMVHAGNLVRANDATPLVVINQVSPIYVSFGVPEAQLPDVKRFMAHGSLGVTASPPGDSTAGPSAGRITFLDNAVDPMTGTIKIKGTFPNEDRRLWPGQFANVVLTLATDPSAVVVPAVAVQTGPQGSYVYVVKPDRSVDLRPITLARATEGEAVVSQGVTPGETVVTDGQLRLVPGSRIAIQNENENGDKASP